MSVLATDPLSLTGWRNYSTHRGN